MLKYGHDVKTFTNKCIRCATNFKIYKSIKLIINIREEQTTKPTWTGVHRKKSLKCLLDKTLTGKVETSSHNMCGYAWLKKIFITSGCFRNNHQISLSRWLWELIGYHLLAVINVNIWCHKFYGWCKHILLPQKRKWDWAHFSSNVLLSTTFVVY